MFMCNLEKCCLFWNVNEIGVKIYFIFKVFNILYVSKGYKLKIVYFVRERIDRGSKGRD